MRSLDWEPARTRGWVDRFDAVMDRHVPWRAELHGTALQLLLEFGATESVVDLGCGPGVLSRWLADRLPGSRVTGLDSDPVMATLAEAHLRGRAVVREQDLTAPGWGTVEPEQCSAAVSSSVLHMVDAAGYALVARELAAAVRPGGLVVDIDELLPAGPAGRLAAACAALRNRVGDEPGAGESYQEWLTALCAEPDLGGACAAREERFGGRPDVLPATVEQRIAALRAAGFAEAAVVERRLDVAVLVAVR